MPASWAKSGNATLEAITQRKEPKTTFSLNISTPRNSVLNRQQFLSLLFNDNQTETKLFGIIAGFRKRGISHAELRMSAGKGCGFNRSTQYTTICE
jgi:hypothetical protein